MNADAERLAADMILAARNVEARVGPVVQRTALAIQKDMRASAPVRTTRLDRTPGPGVTRDSIRATEPDGRAVSNRATDAIIGPRWFVARFLVDGTSRMPPQWNPAASADNHVEGFVRDLARAVTRL